MRIWAQLRGAAPDAYLRTFAKNAIWTTGASAATALAALAETVLLARSLSPSRLGVYFLILAYPEAVQQVLDFRVRDAMTKYLSEFVAQRRGSEGVALIKLLWIADVIVGGIAFAIVAGTSVVVAQWLLHDRGLAPLLVVYAAGIFIGSFDTASGAAMRVVDRFRLAFISGTLAEFQRVMLIAAALAAGAGVHGLVWARAGAYVVTTIILGAAAFVALKPFFWEHRRAPISALRPRYAEIRNFLFGTNLLGIIRALSSKVDTILLGVLASPAAVALYRIALQFAKVALLVADSLYAVVYPAFARVVGLGRSEDTEAIARRLTAVLATIAVPLGLVVGIEAPALLGLVFGDRFSGAATPLRIMLGGIVPYLVVFWAPALLLSLGRTTELLRFATVAVMAQFGAIVGLAPALGASGAAVGFTVWCLVVLVLQLRYLQRADAFHVAAPRPKPNR